MSITSDLANPNLLDESLEPTDLQLTCLMKEVLLVANEKAEIAHLALMEKIGEQTALALQRLQYPDIPNANDSVERLAQN